MKTKRFDLGLDERSRSWKGGGRAPLRVAAKLGSAGLIGVLFVIAVIHLACSPDEEQQAATTNPSLASTTQAIEKVEEKIDPIAQKGQQDAQVVAQTAQDAAGLGIPGAGVVALVASAVGTVLGIYNERRRGTVPLKSAITQVVQSVEAAFPTKTEQQKSALAAVQDQATKQIVSGIKGS